MGDIEQNLLARWWDTRDRLRAAESVGEASDGLWHELAVINEQMREAGVEWGPRP